MNPDEPLRTKSLAVEDPAPMDATLGGYLWLPRMIDKARASRAGTVGNYYKYPCPIDRESLRLLGVKEDEFATLVSTAATGAEVLAGLRELGARPPSAALFDPIALNASLHHGS